MSMLPQPEPVSATTPPGPSVPSGADVPIGLSRRTRAALVGVPPLLLVLYAVLGSATFNRLAESRSASRPVESTAPPDGATLYAMNCANCHGLAGDAQGPSSPLLNPPARHFGLERFRLARTVNGNPTDDDLLAVIRNGIPGTAMPGFPQLSEDELRALVEAVWSRTANGIRKKLIKKFEEEGGIDESELAPLVQRLMQPGDPVVIPNPMPPASSEALARGRTLYVANCASCHGPAGHGDGPQVKDLKTDTGLPTRPRDLSSGLYKGGGSPEHLYLRLSVGMPGTPMPASTTLKPNEICDLVHYVRSLAVKP